MVTHTDALAATRGDSRALSWAVTDPAPQGEAVECSGDSAVVYPRPTSCHEKMLCSWDPRGKLGQATCQGWLSATQQASQHCLLEGKKKSSLEIESRLQMVGTEGSVLQ